MESDKLVIVESPAKARTIERMLGDDYQILASMGHVRDLPERAFGVDIENNFAPQYVETKKKGNIIRQLQGAAKKANQIYLAPDPDREGEAIAWHLQELLKKSTKAEFHRISFHEITRSAVNRAFDHPGNIDMRLVDSQQARRVLDRLVGYQISPLLWSKIERGVSAGRVQSVALRIVCEREREIQAFEPKEYWNFIIELDAQAPGSGKTFHSKLVKIDKNKFDIGNETDAHAALNAIQHGDNFKIEKVDIAPRKRYAPPPFITSTLQQSAGNIGFSASATMRTAQQLYEGIDIGTGGPTGLITYMRTDSVNVAKEAQQTCREYIGREIGPKFVTEKPNSFKSKASAQEAHEAIRPTDVSLTPDQVKQYLDPSQQKLYTLIWKRFVASQMAPAEQQRTTVEIATNGSDNHEYLFRTVATVTVFPGFTKVLNFSERKEDQEDDSEFKDAPAILAELKIGEQCYLRDAKNEQKFTEPPPRYSEATLIRELEANGVGRPSTYATIVNTIQSRKYVSREKGRLIPSELGFKVNDYLVASLPELFQVGFTAEMETKLDKIEEGDQQWTAMLSDFYEQFSEWVGKAKNLNAPEKGKTEKLLGVFGSIQKWDAPTRAGKRYFNDQKFYESLKNKFEKDGVITEKQWIALLSLTVKYTDQLPGIDQLAAENDFSDELAEARTRVASNREEREAAQADSQTREEYTLIFGCFDKVEWEAPVERGNRTYDDKKFFLSLKEQADAGRTLSEKQLNALGRMASKYQQQIENFSKLAELLKIDNSADSEGKKSPRQPNPEVEKCLASLNQVSEWAAPTKKGRRTFDDKAFFESLSDQYNNGKNLSSKQVYALKKLADKYSEKSE